MTQLILEFPLEREDAILSSGGKISVDLGNGVKLTSSIPAWVQAINEVKLQLVMDIDGSPPNANTGEAPKQ